MLFLLARDALASAEIRSFSESGDARELFRTGLNRRIELQANSGFISAGTKRRVFGSADHFGADRTLDRAGAAPE